MESFYSSWPPTKEAPMSSNQRKAKKIKEVFELYRGFILDAAEQEVGESKKWSYLRSRLLRLLSPDRGLESKVIEVVLTGEDDDVQCI